MNIDLCEFCEGCKEKYCFLREIITIDKKYNKRLLMQMKMIEKFKYSLETKNKNDIGWSKSLELWVEDGHAKKFADVYDESYTVKKMSELMNL